MELTKEQIEKIEKEAEMFVLEYFNDGVSPATKKSCLDHYSAAATKYLLQSIEDKDRLEHDVKVAVKAMVKLSEVCDKKDERIKELEDGLKEIKEWSTNFPPSLTNDIHKKAKQLLSK